MGVLFLTCLLILIYGNVSRLHWLSSYYITTDLSFAYGILLCTSLVLEYWQKVFSSVSIAKLLFCIYSEQFTDNQKFYEHIVKPKMNHTDYK